MIFLGGREGGHCNKKRYFGISSEIGIGMMNAE